MFLSQKWDCRENVELVSVLYFVKNLLTYIMEKFGQKVKMGKEQPSVSNCRKMAYSVR